MLSHALDAPPARATIRVTKRVWWTDDPDVAVKYLRAGDAFLREHRALATVEGRGIAPAYLGWMPCDALPSGEIADWRAIYQQRFPHTLASWRRATGARLGVAGSLALAKIVGDLHDLGLCHGDLRASNIVIGRAGEVRLIDFGLSQVIDDACREHYVERDTCHFSYRHLRDALTLPKGFSIARSE